LGSESVPMVGTYQKMGIYFARGDSNTWVGGTLSLLARILKLNMTLVTPFVRKRACTSVKFVWAGFLLILYVSMLSSSKTILTVTPPRLLTSR
jgi:hypothetical protein